MPAPGPSFNDRKPSGRPYQGSDTGRLSTDDVIAVNASQYGAGGEVPFDLGYDNPGELKASNVDFNSALWSGYHDQLKYGGE